MKLSCYYYPEILLVSAYLLADFFFYSNGGRIEYLLLKCRMKLYTEVTRSSLLDLVVVRCKTDSVTHSLARSKVRSFVRSLTDSFTH